MVSLAKESRLGAFRVTTPLDNGSAWHELALEIAGIGVWEWDFVAGEGQWSAGLAALLHLPEDGCALGPDGLLPFVYPDDQVFYRNSIHTAIENGGEHRIEYRVILESGAVRWFLDHAKVFLHEDGTPLKMIGAITDISDQKFAEAARKELERRAGERAAAERALKESEKRLEAILENAPSVVYIKDLEGRLTMVNRAYLNLFQMSREELIGKPGSLVHPAPELHAKIREHDLQVLEGGVPQHFEEEIVVRGEKRTYLSVKFPLKDIDGKPYALCGISADITRRKRTEQALFEKSEQLERAIQEINSFTYSVSHDMGAPLRGVIGNVRFLREELGAVDGSVDDRLHRVEMAALKLGELVDDLLNYTRLGRQEIRLETVDVGECAEKLLLSLQKSREFCKDSFLQVDPDIEVLADHELLGFALRELLENSCKYRQPGKAARIQVRKIEGGFLLEDDGIGIDMAYAHKIFMPFERLHRDTEYPGTGIGLANVKRIIDRHGGHIWVESTPGAGTTFYIRLEPQQSAVEPATAVVSNRLI